MAAGGSCQETGAGGERVRGSLVIVGVVRGDSSPADGRRHPSTSPWRVIPVLLGIGMALRGESTFSSQIKKSPVEVEEGREGALG
ncbi:hypothetical protein VZT92_018029 [Zoarces viviparus]|uniref:Uncharacterized protein n=1 Tax=Zoarces viviparus TaxID=48416 RepID=A0AAW1EPP8_ZOAVI